MPQPPSLHLLEAVWDDGGAVYDCRSGDTHLLDSFTVAVLHAARRGDRSPAAIATVLQRSDATAAVQFSRIESALDQLTAARLL
jgi:PqqD family protein of HPr-rel-A system